MEAMAEQLPTPAAPASIDAHRHELVKEGLTMSLYVAICLLAALVAVPKSAAEAHVSELVWGTTLGLALAHWFAFRASARLVGEGTVRDLDAQIAVAQGAGALAVALLATVPLVVTPGSASVTAVELTLAGFLAVVGFLVARAGGGTHFRAIVYGVALLAVGGVVVVVKLALTGH